MKIYIEANTIDFESTTITAEEIRRMCHAPIDDRVYRAKRAGVPDEEIFDPNPVPVAEGDYFFTTPKFLTGG